MKNDSIKKVGLVASAALLLALGVSAAVGGEVTGNGKSLKNPDGTLNGKSICSFSGLNDTYSGDPAVPDADGFFRTQSWGQLPKMIKVILTAMGMNPGNSCKPSA